MNLLRLLSVIAVLTASGVPALATIECTVHASILYRKTHKPCRHVTILVASAGRETTAITNSKGKCRLEFITCDGCDPKDKGSWISFFEVRKNGSRRLLKTFYRFPKSFKMLGDQEYKTTFYVR